MKKLIVYLNVVLTFIAIALTVIILQNANLIQSAKASEFLPDDTVDINIEYIGGRKLYYSDHTAPASVPVNVTERVRVYGSVDCD